jgi:hypothetical protein
MSMHLLYSISTNPINYPGFSVVSGILRLNPNTVQIQTNKTSIWDISGVPSSHLDTCSDIFHYQEKYGKYFWCPYLPS